jgi:Bacterial Ig-like domain (group 1)
VKNVRVVKKGWGRTAGSIVAISMLVSACGGSSPVRVEILSGNDQSAQAGTLLLEPVRYRVVDDQGGSVPGMSVQVLTIGEAGRIMKSETGVQFTDFVDTTDVLGEGEFFWSLGGPLGEQLASATVVDDAQFPIEGIRSALFTAFAVVGLPSIVLPVKGHLGSAEVGSDADPLVVGVYDPTSNPIPGVDVSWAVTAGGGSLSDVVSTTDSMGLATTTLTVGPTVVDNLVTVTVADQPPVEFSVIGVNPIADPVGDRVPGAGGVPPDLIAYQGLVIDGMVVFHMRFNQTANSSAVGGPNAVHGFIEIDIDQDPATGNTPIIDDRPGNTVTGLGIEYRIIIQLQNGLHQVSILPSGSTVYNATAAFSGRTITIRVPLSAFGGDDGNMNYGILVGTFLRELGVLAQTAPTDWAPQSGWATIVP